MNPGRGTAQAAGPAWRVVLALSAAVLVAHLVLLSNAAGLAPVLHPAARPDVPPLQTRLIAPAAPQPPAAPVAAAVTTSAAPGRASARMLAQSTAPEQLLSPAPMQEPAAEPVRTPESPLAPAAAENTAAPPLDAASVAQSDAGTMPVASSAQAPIDGPIAVADTSAADESARTEQVARADPSATTVQAAGRTGGPAAVTEAETANTSAIHSASGLTVDRAHLPPSLVMEYEMTGMDRGLNYHASGELRWQHNEERYNLSLTVRALLLGSREWRSQGLIGSQGLQPQRFSDKRRSERATHFDREGGRVVFSGSAAPVPLAPGAQDQISLYVQMAAAIASAATPMTVGTQLQVQTATTRDALPWLLTLERHETLRFEGAPLDTAYWVCMPRQRFDARVELWTSPLHHHLPARIRITQASGSFIDLQLRSLKALAPLPA